MHNFRNEKPLLLLFCLGSLPVYVSIVKYLNSAVEIEQHLFLVCLFLLGLFVLLPVHQNSEPIEAPYAKIWHVSAGLLFFVMTALVVYVNPHGRYPWNPYPFTTTAAHYQKIALYNQLKEKPQIVILGSSHAFAIPSNYLAQVFDASTFNMSVGGAGSIDELALARYVLDHDSPPSLFLVEIVATDLRTRVWQYYVPLSLIPYLEPDQRWPVIKSVFRDTLNKRSLIDALFLLTRFDLSGEFIAFSPDGTGLRNNESASVNSKDYNARVNQQIPSVYQRNVCFKLDDVGKHSIVELAALSEKHHFSIVFYRSPLSIEFFERVDLEKPAYKKCQALFSDFMQALTEKYTSVQYVDLLYYEPVSALRRDGYIDVQHLTLNASKQVIDALHLELERGLQWSEQK